MSVLDYLDSSAAGVDVLSIPCEVRPGHSARVLLARDRAPVFALIAGRAAREIAKELEERGQLVVPLEDVEGVGHLLRLLVGSTPAAPAPRPHAPAPRPAAKTPAPTENSPKGRELMQMANSKLASDARAGKYNAARAHEVYAMTIERAVLAAFGAMQVEVLREMGVTERTAAGLADDFRTSAGLTHNQRPARTGLLAKVLGK